MIRETLPLPDEETRQIEEVAAYPLLQALIERRTRRFAPGMRLNGGPLAYESSRAPQPLSLAQEAALAFAACGITGATMGEMPYESGDRPEAGQGNVLLHYIGRTVGSADGVHAVSMCVLNDEGAWLLKRPQDYDPSEIPGLVEDAREHRLVALYEKSRVQIADERPALPTESETIGIIPFNKWAANQPGTTYFVPINEYSALYINLLLMLFSEEVGAFFVDDRNNLQPAGIGKFGRSRGGHLNDDPSSGRYTTMAFLEGLTAELITVEQGQMLHNLALMTQALGLGGFPHFAGHPYLWLQALGCRMEVIPFSRSVGAGPILRTAARLLKRDQPLPTAVGLERAGEVLIRPFCPPYYRTMEEAVLAFVAFKADLRRAAPTPPWRNAADIAGAIPGYSDRAIAATIAYCDYVYRRYGRFPAHTGPLRTILAYQAHHLDPEFYDRFYRPEALGEAQRSQL